MKFVIDKQTLEDLNLLGKYKNNSIFNLFNHTVTRGGEQALERMFTNPFTDSSEINSRRDVLEFFQKENFSLPFSKEQFDIAERYLNNTDKANFIMSFFGNFKRKVMKLVANDKELGLLEEGMVTAIVLLKDLDVFFKKVVQADGSAPYMNKAEIALKILHGKNLEWIFREKDVQRMGFNHFASCDHKLRFSAADSMLELFKILYDLDAFISVSNVGRSRGFCFATAVEEKESRIEIKGVYHPCIPKAVANDIHLDAKSNVLFLTGANMAGKSTLMKSFAVSLYLAHMGFPLAVKSMEFTVQEGIYTSINVPDNINMGYSHFYAEVMRVKHIATEVSSGKHLIVIFDELFKGTNVKDAYDATVAVTEAFSKIHACCFIVSTHIMEAGMTLKEKCDNIKFKYLPTTMNGNVPVYTYVLADGISNDRHGMRIINNERIIDIIKGTV